MWDETEFFLMVCSKQFGVTKNHMEESIAPLTIDLFTYFLIFLLLLFSFCVSGEGLIIK